jgi:hypothetical protein
MKNPSFGLFIQITLVVALPAFFLGLTTGCGIGSLPATVPGIANPTAMTGALHGGPNPVIGAAVALYITQNNGYGGAALLIASTTSSSEGYFSFTLPPGFSCPAGQFAYITAYGGNTGSLAVNNNSLLMAPVGSCESSYSGNTYLGQSIWLDELTTAASAYALNNFTTIDTSGPAPVVNISAPANNNAITPCIAGVGSCVVTAASGLRHAFSNALSFVNNQTGQPNATNANAGIIPAAEIDLLGNILQACVNSAGVTGANMATANDGSGCGKLFSLTTPPTPSAATPANTLQAMLNLAHFPNPLVNTWNPDCTLAGTGTATATSCLFGLAAPSGAYAGALTSAPPDWALAVVYPTGTGSSLCASGSTCAGINYTYHLALDYADNVYVLSTDASTATYTNIVGLEFDGTPIFATANDTTDKLIKFIATDGAGHVFGANSDITSGTDVVKIYSTATGAVLATSVSTTATPVAITADPFNNIYYVSNAPGGNLRKLTYSGTSAAPVYASSSVTTTAPTQGILQIGFNANLDLYMLGNGSTAPLISLLPNTGTTNAPTYPLAATTTAITGSTSNAYGVAADINGNALAIDSLGVTKITKTGTGATATMTAGTPTPVPAVYNSVLYSRYLSVDGLNNVFSPDNGNGSAIAGVTAFDTTDNLALGSYKGCRVTGHTCNTATTTDPIFGPRGAAIDSAGDIWVASATARVLTELIGVAAPTWPGLSLARFGRPQ